MFLDPDFAALLAEDERDFDGMLAIDGTVYRAREGRRTLRFCRAGRSFFIKQHRGVGWREIVKNLANLRLPVLSARNEWLAIRHLAGVGIGTARLVGGGLRGRNPARLESFVVTEDLGDTISLEQLTLSWRDTPPDPVLKRRLIREVADIARRMHGSGLNHRDFDLCHFRRARDGERLYLIDLHRAQIRARTPRRWIIKDLSGLYFSSLAIGLTRRDLYRFMTVYADRPLRDVLTADRRFWRRVERKAVALYRHLNGTDPPSHR
jgi:heptose I phosphotransferase